MFLSIIIPHRNRNDRLALCVVALEHATHRRINRPWEIVVVDANSRSVPQASALGEHVRVIHDNQDGTLYNKAHALNLGIEQSDGEVITFLDADAVVGNSFLRGADTLMKMALHRVCYRVRKIQLDTFQQLGPIHSFASYDSLPLGYEAYGRWDNNRLTFDSSNPWGNSQFSISRETLGETRYDEEYQGRGYEDLDMNMRLWAKFGRGYRGKIFTTGPEAMFHIDSNKNDPTWNDPNEESRSATRYMNKRREILAARPGEVAA